MSLGENFAPRRSPGWEWNSTGDVPVSHALLMIRARASSVNSTWNSVWISKSASAARQASLAERRGHPERVWRVAWVSPRDLEANREFGLLPAPVLDRVTRDAKPAAVHLVELDAGEDGL